MVGMTLKDGHVAARIPVKDFEEFGSSRCRATTRADRPHGEQAAWFRDCDANLFGIGQPIR